MDSDDHGLTLDDLRVEDLDQVLPVEQASFAAPWRREHFRFEILENRHAVNRVVRRRGTIVGYACVWHLPPELKINNLVVAESSRGCGIGRWLLDRILEDARRAGCRSAMLEVRTGNHPALSLYRRAGFVEVARRRGYYSEGEDAILMERVLGAQGS